MNRISAKVLSKTETRQSAILASKQARELNRRNQRALQFSSSRGIDVPVENAIQTRAQRMEEYRQSKLQQKREAQKMKLPPFRAGIVRHTLDSPYRYFEKNSVSIPNKTFKFKLKPKLPPPKLTIPYSPKFSRIRGHEGCHEKTSNTTVHTNCALPSTSRGRALSIRNHPARPVPNQTVNTRATTRLTRHTKEPVKENNIKPNTNVSRNSRETGIPKLSVENLGRKISFEPRGSRNGSRNVSFESKIPRPSPRTSTNPTEVFGFTSKASSRTSTNSIEVFNFTSKPIVETKRNSKLMDVFSCVPVFDKSGGCVETLNIEEKAGQKGNPVVSAMEAETLNDSIDIPEHFVRKKSLKASLRRSFITPSKDVEPSNESLTGVNFQRRRLNEERNLLHRHCSLWQGTLDSSDSIPTEVRDDIDCVLGQTQLLTRDKFEQMSRLIDQYEMQESAGTQDSGPRLLENDLDSFWEMMFIQVALMYKNFDRLKRLEKDGWVDKEEEEEKREKENKKKTKAKTGKPAVKVTAKSRIADFIRSKRNETKNETSGDDVKEFDGGFFKVESPVSQKTRSRESRLTPHIQKSILKNKMSSLNIIAVSPLAKSLAASTLVDFCSTPADETRGILKKTGTSTAKPKHATPSGKKICFSLSDPSQDEEIFSTPRESPRKQIRKTPHKAHSPDALPSLTIELASPELKDNGAPSPQPLTPKATSDSPAFLPRKSPRVSKPPERFSFNELGQLLLGEKKGVISPRKTPRATPKRTSRNTSSTKSGKFVLRPSKLTVS